LQHAKLMAESQDLKLQCRSSAEDRQGGGEQCRYHGGQRQLAENAQLPLYQADLNSREYPRRTDAAAAIRRTCRCLFLVDALVALEPLDPRIRSKSNNACEFRLAEPGGPSIRSGFRIRAARKTTLSVTSSITYLANSSFSDSSSMEANIFRATFEHDPTPESIQALRKFLTLIPMMQGGDP
jgi:hypothetical protein